MGNTHVSTPLSAITGSIISSILTYRVSYRHYSDWNSLFVRHILSMSHAWFVLAFLGILVQKGTTHRQRNNIHAILQLISLITSWYGFYAIYLNKEERKKPHFNSWHSYAGVFTLIFQLLSSTYGIMAYLEKRSPEKYFQKYINHREVHKYLSIITIISGFITCGLAIGWSAWAERALNKKERWIMLALTGLLLLISFYLQTIQ